MKVALLSNHISGAVKLTALSRLGVPVSHVVTLGPEAAAKAQVAGYHAFPGPRVHQCERFDLGGAADRAFFAREAFDLLLIGGWQRLVPAAILSLCRLGAIAEHGSAEYLPRGRGRSPVAWSLLQGRQRFVLHLFRATADVDAGPIVARRSFELTPFDTCKTVYCKIGLVSAQMTAEVLPRLETGTLEAL